MRTCGVEGSSIRKARHVAKWDTVEMERDRRQHAVVGGVGYPPCGTRLVGVVGRACGDYGHHDRCPHCRHHRHDPLWHVGVTVVSSDCVRSW